MTNGRMFPQTFPLPAVKPRTGKPFSVAKRDLSAGRELYYKQAGCRATRV